MHELAAAQRILRAVLEEMDRRGGAAVRSVDVDVGELDGLRGEALREAFLVEAEGTPAAGAVLHVRVRKAGARCPACEATKPVGAPRHPGHGPVRAGCPDCGAALEISGFCGVEIRRATLALEAP